MVTTNADATSLCAEDGGDLESPRRSSSIYVDDCMQSLLHRLSLYQQEQETHLLDALLIENRIAREAVERIRIQFKRIVQLYIEFLQLKHELEATIEYYDMRMDRSKKRLLAANGIYFEAIATKTGDFRTWI